MPNKRVHIVHGLFILFLFTNCSGPDPRGTDRLPVIAVLSPDTGKLQTHHQTDQISDFEQLLMEAELLDVQSLNSDIRVDLRYADTNNFLKTKLYPTLSKAYLTETCAKKLAVAQAILSLKNPEVHLLVWDAVRPVSVQKKMWESLDMPAEERGLYVSSPSNRSLHNYGCAVDLTIVEEGGIPLDMGTDFDAFDSLAQPRFEWRNLSSGKLTQLQLDNRKLLRDVMKRAGFTTLPTEWWHFNCISRRVAKAQYRVIQ